MQKFNAKLSLFMGLIGAGAVITSVCVPYWSREHISFTDIDYYTGLFTCRYHDPDISKIDCDLSMAWEKLPSWFIAVRCLMVISGIFTVLIVLLLILFLCQNGTCSGAIIKVTIPVCFITAILLVSAVILSGLKFTKLPGHVDFSWAYGLAIGSTVDYFIIVLPLWFEKQAANRRMYASI